ncbi:hypothetical protein HYV86_06815 [Candidatus Woesearchaeota archaeon]|nr:hypothetical protein [Candidatus Woesearchaeota archaeon]
MNKTYSPFEDSELTVIDPPTLDRLLHIEPTDMKGSQARIFRVIDPDRPGRIMKIWTIGNLIDNPTAPFLDAMYVESKGTGSGRIYVGEYTFPLPGNQDAQARIYGVANEISALTKITRDRELNVAGSNLFPRIYSHGLALSESGNLVAYVEMDEVQGKTLQEYLTALNSPERKHRADYRLNIARKAAWGLAKGTHYLRKAGIDHRDLKPENIFISGNTCNFVDKGCSLGVDLETFLPEYLAIPDLHARRKQGIISGTPEYMSLQQAMGEFDPTGNIYAATIMFSEILSGNHPFKLKDETGARLPPIAIIIKNQSNTDLPVHTMEGLEQSPVWPLVRHTSRDIEAIVSNGLSRNSDERQVVPKLMYDWAKKVA